MGNVFEESFFTQEKEQIIMDFNSNGGFDINGQVKRVYGKDALSQAILQWAQLLQGEKLRRPTSGGRLFSFLLKPINNLNAISLEETIRVGLENDFRPKVIINYLKVNPNFKENKYEIELGVSTKDLKIQSDISMQLKVRGT